MLQQVFQKIRRFSGIKGNELDHHHRSRLDRVNEAVRDLAGVDPSEREWCFIHSWLARHAASDSHCPTYFWCFLGDGSAKLTFKISSDFVSIRNAFTREQILVA